MEDDLNPDALRKVYVHAMKESDAAAMSLTTTTTRQELARQCTEAFKQIAGLPGPSKAGKLEGKIFDNLWGNLSWCLLHTPVGPEGRWVFACHEKRFPAVVKMASRQYTTGGYA